MKKIYSLLLLRLISLCGVSAQQSESVTTESAVEADVRSGQDNTALTPNEARKHRGFSTNDVIVPKGQWIFGGTASYTTHRNQNYKLLIIDGIESEGYTVNVAPMIAFAPWRNMAVGVRFGYGRSLLALDNAALSFGEGESGVTIAEV